MRARLHSIFCPAAPMPAYARYGLHTGLASHWASKSQTGTRNALYSTLSSMQGLGEPAIHNVSTGRRE